MLAGSRPRWGHGYNSAARGPQVRLGRARRRSTPVRASRHVTLAGMATEPNDHSGDDDSEGLDPRALECFKRARDTWGTAEVATLRASRTKRWLRSLNFVGLAVPLVIGGLAIAYSINGAVRLWLVGTASALLIIQTVVALWALTAKWDDNYTDSMRSVAENRRLFRAFDGLLRNRPADPGEFQRRLELLIAEDDATQQYDYSRGEWTDAERRYGMRSGLIRMEAKCPSCGIVPKSINTSDDCGACGGFTTSRYRAPRLRSADRGRAKRVGQ